MADLSKPPPRAAPGAADPPKALTPAEREARMMATLTNSVFILTVLACMATVHWLRDLLTPLMVAVFSLILIDALARNVGRFAPALPEWSRVGIAFVVISLVLVAAGALVVHSLPRFAADMVEAVAQAQQLGFQLTSQFNLPRFARFEQLDLRPYFSDLLSRLREMATNIILVLIYLGFLLASRRTFDHKVQVLFPTSRAREHAQRVFRRVRRGAERYVLLQAFKGLLLGSLFWVVLRVFGMHDSVFLSFLVFLASFIPIVGPAAAVAIPVVLALAQYGFGWRPVLLFVSLQALVVAIDSVLLPRLQGDRLDVDPVVVLVSLSFWYLIFGIIGALFSTVLTVVVIAVAAESPRIRWLAVVLSKRGGAVIPNGG
ncbi:MAG: AI-2E family transporter [Caulobacteraceae bacterium]